MPGISGPKGADTDQPAEKKMGSFGKFTEGFKLWKRESSMPPTVSKSIQSGKDFFRKTYDSISGDDAGIIRKGAAFTIGIAVSIPYGILSFPGHRIAKAGEAYFANKQPTLMNSLLAIPGVPLQIVKQGAVDTFTTGWSITKGAGDFVLTPAKWTIDTLDTAADTAVKAMTWPVKKLQDGFRAAINKVF